MIRTMMAAATALALLPPAAEAQHRYTPLTDLEYCWELAELYQRHIGGGEGAVGTLVRQPDPEGRYAVDKCQQGDTATAIPILERKLLANRFTLPWR
jgi:hypothetical protein